MTATPPSQPGGQGRDRRLIALAVVVPMVLAVAAAVLVVWLFFFAMEAPAAPTFDDALKVLSPSAAPG